MITTVAMTAMTFVADAPRQTGPDFGKASPAGLVITLILLIGVVTLVWSMNKHLRRLPESFDPEHPEPDQAVDDGTVGIGDAGVGDTGSARPQGAEPESKDG